MPDSAFSFYRVSQGARRRIKARRIDERSLPPPSTERGLQSRQRILEAAESVFGEKGYFPASITDITRKAGIAQGTFYLYFKSKHDVFVELLEHLARMFRQVTRAALDGARGRIEEEERGFAAFFASIDRHPYVYRILRQAEFVDPAAFRAYYAGIVAGYARRLRRAIERGEVRRLDPETLVYCLFGVGDLVGMRWPYWTGKPVPQHVFETMMQFIRYGIDPRDDGRETVPKRQKETVRRRRSKPPIS